MDPSSGGNNDVTIEISKLNNGNQDGANGTNDDVEQPKEHTSSFYSRNMQLVELSLEHVTYAPATRSAAAAGGARTCCTKTKVNNRRITILSDVTSKISPYQLSAWMGPSGSGKTSLVSVAAGLLSDPTNDLVNDSCIKINGEMGSLPKRLVGVVWQDDLLFSNLTVKETVQFVARLKTPQQKSDNEAKILVEDKLSRLGLSHVQDSLTGVPGGSGKNRGYPIGN